MDCLITLVHGTFAKDAPWTKNYSSFCRNIRGQLGDQTIFEIFNWTGRNSHRTRMNEADKLVKILTSQIREYPEKKKIIIAHSHGGNIAMYALNQLEYERSCFDLVTMSTPFLNFRQNKLFKNIERYLLQTEYSIMMLLGTTMLAVLYFFFFEVIGVENWIVAAIVISVSLISIYIINFNYVGPRVNKYLGKKRDYLSIKIQHILDFISLENLNPQFPILVVIDYDDEVKWWLGGLYRIWGLLLHTEDILSRLLYKLIIIPPLCLAISCALLWINKNYFQTNPIYISNVQKALKISLILLILSPLLVFLTSGILYLIKSNPLMLGWESWIHQMFIKTVPASTPFRYHNLTFIQYNMDKKKIFSLRHSIYENETVVNDISDWIKGEKPVKYSTNTKLEEFI